MKRSFLALCLLALALVGVVAAPATATGPALSAGCASLHAFEPNGTVGSSATIDIGPFTFNAGEEMRVASISDSSGTGPFVTIARAGHPDSDAHLSGTVGDVQYYSFPATDTYAISIKSRFPPSSYTVQLGCGLPPTPTLSIPAGTIYVGQHVEATVACAAGTNTVATCVDTQGTLPSSCAATGCARVLDTSIPGSYSYQVTGTDSRGLTRGVQAGYEVVRRPQTITMTSAAPTGVIYDRDDFGYAPTATASSGLPVTFEVPTSTACYATQGALGSSDPNAITVHWSAPGVCTVIAEQAGNTEYDAAPVVVQHITVGKETSSLTAARANKGVAGLTPTVFSATLYRTARFGPGTVQAPFAGQTVIFSVAGKDLCSAKTNSKGVGTCNAKIGSTAAAKQKTYQVRYAGDAFTEGTSATGVLWSLLG